VRDDCQSLLAAAEQLPRAQLPELLGEIETIRVTALARLTTTEPVALAPLATTEPVNSADGLIPISAAADRLGMSESYLYKNHADFSFTRRIGNKLLFSTAEIAAFLKKRTSSGRKEYTSPNIAIQQPRRRRRGNE
jgi:predicted DNA-binding transcriptional regulator AlpA